MDDQSLRPMPQSEMPKISPDNPQEHVSDALQSVEHKDLFLEKTKETTSSENDSKYGQVLARVKSLRPPSDDAADVSQDASEAHQKPNREQQINHLVELTISKGLHHAVATAEHLRDYYMLDQLHDRLVHDELHEKLIQSGVLKKE